MDNYFYEANGDVINKIKDINQKIHDENGKDIPDNGYITKMMYEQMLTGLYLNNQMKF